MREPIIGPTVWTGSDYPDKDSVSIKISPVEVAALNRAVELSLRRPLETLKRLDFSDLSLVGLMVRIRKELIGGRGLVVLRGFPTDNLGKLERMFWGLNQHLGTPVSQSVMGERIGHVLDRSKDDPTARGYRQRYELTPHSDFQEIVSFLCARQGIAGGVSWFVSGHTLHNQILKLRPDLLEILYRGYFTHRFGEQAPSEHPITPHRVPIFSENDGFVSCRLLRRYIEAAANEQDGLTSTEREALELIDSLSMDTRFGVAFKLEEGEAVFMNNYVVFHGRTGFRDGSITENQRHLIRIWLAIEPPRPVNSNIYVYASESAQLGIAAQEGKVPSYNDADTVKKVYGDRMPEF